MQRRLATEAARNKSRGGRIKEERAPTATVVMQTRYNTKKSIVHYIIATITRLFCYIYPCKLGVLDLCLGFVFRGVCVALLLSFQKVKKPMASSAAGNSGDAAEYVDIFLLTGRLVSLTRLTLSFLPSPTPPFLFTLLRSLLPNLNC